MLKSLEGTNSGQDMILHRISFLQIQFKIINICAFVFAGRNRKNRKKHST